MADQSDVENALVALAVSALYPNGNSAPSAPGPDCLIYPGWPTSAALDSDLAAGRINVTVFPTPEPGRNTTRYRQRWLGPAVQAALTASVVGVTVTIAGTANAGQLVGILIDGTSYVYRTQTSDTPETVAAQLAAFVRTNRIVNLAGAGLTFPGARQITARVVADVPVLEELRRQEQGFRITCWCPTPATRDAAASAIDSYLAGVQFISLADGTEGRLHYRNTLVFDQSQDALLYRRDLIYDVEYATTLAALQPSMLFGNLILNAATFTA